MEGFTSASALYLNMGFYQMKQVDDADSDAQKLFTIVFPWEKYKYKRLSIGIKIAPDDFQMSCQSLSKIWNMLRQSPILMIC
jgi:hypothetical protein